MGRHKEWRKIAKKIMRKRKRIRLAKQRDLLIQIEEEKRAQSPSYELWLKEQEELELFRENEEKRLLEEQNERWLREEQLAQERWIKQQKRLEHLRAERAKQELIIKEEWEKEQLKLKQEAEAREREKERKEREQAELLERIERYISGESDHLPSSARTVTETQPGFEACPFFSKVGACRFRDDCSRNHIRPSVSRTLLLPGFYSNFRIEHVNQFNEYDTDVGLEFDDKEVYDDFLEFYDDVLKEMKTFGHVVQFKVCCNEETHLRGNVYVQFSEERYAMKAFRALQGRYYGGKKISVEFCGIKSWSKALCGLHYRKKCPKGGKCNFLHAFRNPDREFRNADRDSFEDSVPSSSARSKEKLDWNWSPSSESSVRRSSRREDERVAREKQNWDWSPEAISVSRAKLNKNSSSREGESSRHSSRKKRERERSASGCRKSKKRDHKDDKSDDDRSDRSSRKRRSKENRRFSRRSHRVRSDEETY